jgi:hypothetical protein
MDARGMPRYRTPLAVITQDHAPSGRKAGDPKTAFVNRYGDPLGLKSNTWVSLLTPVSTLANFQLRPTCVVTHLECEMGRISKVHYRDASGVSRSSRVDRGGVLFGHRNRPPLRVSALGDAEFDQRIHHNMLGAYFWPTASAGFGDRTWPHDRPSASTATGPLTSAQATTS